jgi:ApbE superfamily uncharacterized protein (UPF0280 family)
MSAEAQAHLLEGGQRLHLHHGPIDLIIGVEGPERMRCFARATVRFQTVLQALAVELSDLRKPLSGAVFTDPIARRMARAVAPYDVFVTPMAAVAGAVADEILTAMMADGTPIKAYVNNGGDIAFHLEDGQQMTSLGLSGTINLTAKDTARGLATSGWQGRSHSLGIADAVTVAAPTAAAADVAATLIANAVDLPDHLGIKRTLARDLNPDSDLGKRPVTTDVPTLTETEIDAALANGAALAHTLLKRGLICQAALTLQGRSTFVSSDANVSKGTLAHA